MALLFRDLLIGVTTLFRDTNSFQALEEHVIPHLFEGRGAGDAVRVWPPKAWPPGSIKDRGPIEVITRDRSSEYA